MREAQWLACADPGPMLEFLRDKASDRKLRLFAVACCRMAWSMIAEGPLREAIRIAEEHVDGNVDDAKARAAVSAAHRARRKRHSLDKAVYDTARFPPLAEGVAEDVARRLASSAVSEPSPTAVSRVIGGEVVIEQVPPNAARFAWNELYASHLKSGAWLLRDIFGNPFRSVAFDPAWRTSNVLDLARTSYDERELPSGHLDHTRLPILADALLDAGCDSADILSHSRGEGPHVRGCWVVDLLLGKS